MLLNPSHADTSADGDSTKAYVTNPRLHSGTVHALTKSCDQKSVDANGYIVTSSIWVAMYHWFPNVSFTAAVRSPYVWSVGC